MTKKQSNKRANEIFDSQTDKAGEGAVYIFELNKKTDIDGSVDWNTARFINHSCDPNCEAENEDGKHIWIEAQRNIKKGDELNYNYGYALDEWYDHPCKCGEINCVGYIVDEDLWPELKKRIARRNASKKKK